MNRVSFNVNAERLRNQAYFFDFMNQYQPTSVTVMNAGHEFLANLLSATDGNTAIIRRQYSEAEGRQWRNVNPMDYVNDLIDGLDPRIWVYVLNEPSAHGDDLPLMLNWLINVGEILEAKGYRACLGNLGAAVWTEQEVESGLFDTYLGRLADWSEREVHYGGWHEYTGILLPFGVGFWPTEYLLNGELIQPDTWPKDLPIEKVPVFNEDGLILRMEMPHYYHLLRSSWFDIRAESVGLGTHKKFITEFGWDRMPDLTQQMPNIYTELEQMYGIPNNVKNERYATMRGPLTLRNVWAGQFPDMSFETIMDRQLTWVEEIYPKNYMGFHIFTWSYLEPTWDLKNGFDCSGLYDLHQKLILKKDIEIEKPKNKPEPKWYWEFLKKIIGWLIDKLTEVEEWLNQK